MRDEQAEQTAAPAKRRGRAKLILVIGAALLALAGGGAAYFLVIPPAGSSADARQTLQSEVAREDIVFVDLPELLVNLNVTGRRLPFLKIATALAAPAVLETSSLTGRGAAPPDLEPAAGPRQPAAAAATTERQANPSALAARTPAPPAGAPRRLALDRLSQGEIEVLQQLAERRAELDRRERQLDRHAALLATAEASLAGQLERLEQLRADIAATVAAHDAREEAKLASLVKIYETMKPKAAAEIFNRLEMPLLITVVERMRAPKSADVLARMDPAKAKQVTAELARRAELLRAGGDG